jgi:hypothetical protein
MSRHSRGIIRIKVLKIIYTKFAHKLEATWSELILCVRLFLNMQLLNKLTQNQRLELEKGVIEVEGKAMNRTALGVVAAIFKLYPNITFSELKEMLPDTINPSAPKNYKSLFRPYSDRMYGVVQPGSIRKECKEQGLDITASHFIEEGETFITGDGIEVLVSKTWESKDTETGEHDLQNLINHVKQYGINVVSFESKKPFKKGDYHLDVINPGFIEVLNQNDKKTFPWWVVILVLIILLTI